MCLISTLESTEMKPHDLHKQAYTPEKHIICLQFLKPYKLSIIIINNEMFLYSHSSVLSIFPVACLILRTEYCSYDNCTATYSGIMQVIQVHFTQGQNQYMMLF
jgi:hypothetical protein